MGGCAMDSLTKPEAIVWARKDIWSVDEAALLLSGISLKEFSRALRNYHNGAFADEKEFRACANWLQASNDNSHLVKTVLQLSQPAAETPAGWIRHAVSNRAPLEPPNRGLMEPAEG